MQFLIISGAGAKQSYFILPKCSTYPNASGNSL